MNEEKTSSLQKLRGRQAATKVVLTPSFLNDAIFTLKFMDRLV